MILPEIIMILPEMFMILPEMIMIVRSVAEHTGCSLEGEVMSWDISIYLSLISL